MIISWLPSALRIISGVIFFTTHNFTMLACCHSFHQPCFQLQWNITKKKKKKKNSLYATAPAPRVRVSYALEHSPTREPVFLRSLWGQTEHKVNIVFIISRPETGLHCKLRWHLVNLPKPGLRERSFWLSRCVPVSEICWVGFYCFFELSENATFPDFAVT